MSDQPALEALPGGKDEPASPVRSEKELRTALAQLRQRHAIQKNYMQLPAARADWHGVMDAAADLREIEAHIEALQFALKETDSIR